MFTTLRVYQRSLTHRLTNWQAHCDRLRHSIEFFGWQQPNWQQLRYGAATLSDFSVLRITVFPNGREWITARSLPDDLTNKQKYGVKAYLAPSELRRSLPHHKTGNYLSAWFAKTTAQQLDAGEAILVDESGNWLETSTGNLWGWRDDCWWTPPLAAGILPGVARSQILEWIKDNDQHVKEEPWLAEAVDSFEAIAYSNSVVEIVPIHTVIERQTVGQIIPKKYDSYHPSVKLLQQLYAA